MTFGTHIKTLRTTLGLGLRELAARVGISPGYLSRMERDQWTPPSDDVVLRLATELGEDPDVLLGLAGRVSAEIQQIIAKRPRQFAALIRQLKDAPAEVIEEMAREVRDGDW